MRYNCIFLWHRNFSNFSTPISYLTPPWGESLKDMFHIWCPYTPESLAIQSSANCLFRRFLLYIFYTIIYHYWWIKILNTSVWQTDRRTDTAACPYIIWDIIFICYFMYFLGNKDACLLAPQHIPRYGYASLCTIVVKRLHGHRYEDIINARVLYNFPTNRIVFLTDLTTAFSGKRAVVDHQSCPRTSLVSN